MHSNRYIFIYSLVMVILVAAALTVVAIQLKPAQDNNIRIEKMQNILYSVHIPSTPANAETEFKKAITEQFVVNSKGERVEGNDAFKIDIAAELKKEESQRNLPVFYASLPDGSKKIIVPLRGKGLWGPVWGYFALNEDCNTVFGTMFDHKSETPGLGAEINTPDFQDHFIDKTIFDDSGNFTSIKVLKGGAQANDVHGVDAISGGTITSKAVEKMIFDCLSLYSPFFKNQKQQ
jgi:Na+-transporting NADH:ubiquinone oxidoreductase subunit C